jgi:hypothetical protein
MADFVTNTMSAITAAQTASPSPSSSATK